MKRTILTISLLTSLILLTACGNTIESTDSSADNTAQTAAASETQADVSAETQADAPAETKADVPAETKADAPAETKADAPAETQADAPAESKADAPAPAPTEAAASASDADFTSIAGDWYVDGDPSKGALHIESDGSYRLYHAEGFIESQGTIRREEEDIEGTVIYWYRFYDTDNEFVMSILDDGSSAKTDLYVGNGAEPHYQKYVGGAAEDGREPGEEFLGTWGCGRATLEITQISSGEFHAKISWSSSAASHAEWDYPLTYQDGKLVCSGKGTLTNVEYASADADPEETVEYTNGSAEFSMQGAGIIWNDLTEHSGDDMVFTNTLAE